MHSKSDRTGQSYPKPVGFGRLAYDPINKTFWYYGFGRVIDQGGGEYPGPTNFGTQSLDTFLALLRKQLEYALPEIERLTLERVNDKG